MEIRAAAPEEFEAAMGFYHRLTDAMQASAYRPGWEKDVYPARQYVADAIGAGELHLAYMGAEIVGAMVVDHHGNDGYAGAGWRVDAPEEALLVIHALGVSPRHQGRGLAKSMVAHAIGLGRAGGMRAIRLDVLAANLPAQRLYAGMGFAHVGTVGLFYEDTGLTDFLLYELTL